MGPLKQNYAELPLSQIQCDPELWGPNAQPRVRSWLIEHYDRDTMPHLQVVTLTDGRPGYWLLGWHNEGTKWPALLAMIFGQEYADERLRLVRIGLDVHATVDKHGQGEYGARSDRKGN